MIEPINHTPACFKHLSPGHRFYELSEGGSLYGYWANGLVGKMCGIHFEVIRFSKSVWVEMEKDFAEMMEIIKAIGAKDVVVALKTAGDERMYKTLCKYGFDEPRLVALSSRSL